MAAAARRNMAEYRRRLGPLQVWVPDLRNPEVRAQLATDALVVCDHAGTAEGQAFVDAALADIEGRRG